MKARVAEVRIKEGMPTVEQARRRLGTEIDVARSHGVRVLKLIHGYGSSGRGGRLRGALRSSLEELATQGLVRRAVTGEQWSIFDETSRALLGSYPELRKDADLERGNAGITLIELR
jgi:hypothetical protein